MDLLELDFFYPERLVATEPQRPSRVLLSEADGVAREISLSQLLALIPAGDVLVVNDTKVMPMRVWSMAGDEVLFVRCLNALEWEVLFPARDYSIGARLQFPGGISATLKAKGLPQLLQFEYDLGAAFFAEHGEPALPPYIQAARGERHARPEDWNWYQSSWAKNPGSSAAPTASLHFAESDMQTLIQRGVRVARLTLHVGLGTFLPIKAERLEDHIMHHEEVSMDRETAAVIQQAKSDNRKVWSLGTTSMRALEAWAGGELIEGSHGFSGKTNLFIQPGYQFQIVDRLLTNFHQPRSTLLALVMAFAGRQRTRAAYQLAIENNFRLFSYGDLTAWIR